MFTKAQSSLEFLTIFGIGFSMILILGGIFFTYSLESKQELDKDQLDVSFSQLISTMEQIYFLGEGNRVTQKLMLPDGIKNISIIHLNASNATDELYIDYLNISVYSQVGVQYLIYMPQEEYIRFNCSLNCSETPNVNGNWTSSYLPEASRSGPKTIRLENKGDFIAVDFIFS